MTTRRMWNIGFYFIVGILVAGIVAALTILVTRANTLPYGGGAPDFKATTSHSKPFQFSNLNGKVRLVTFFYTNCADQCPLTAHQMEMLAQKLRPEGLYGSKVDFVSVTLDPKRDTLPVLNTFASHFHAANDPNWYFVRATPDATTKILANWGVSVKQGSNPEDLEHQLATVLVDANGNIRKRYNTANLDISQINKDIQNVLSHQKLG